MIRPESVFTTVELMNWFHLPSRLLKMISELWLKVRVQRGPAECFCNSKPMETSATPQQAGLFHLILNPFQKAIFSLAFDTQWYINFAVFKILCHFKNLVSSHLLDHFIPLMVTGRLHTRFKNLLTIFVLLSLVLFILCGTMLHCEMFEMCYINETAWMCKMTKFICFDYLISNSWNFALKTSCISCITTCGTLSIFNIQFFNYWEDTHTNCYLSYSLSSSTKDDWNWVLLIVLIVQVLWVQGGELTAETWTAESLPWYSRLVSRCLVDVPSASSNGPTWNQVQVVFQGGFLLKD